MLTISNGKSEIIHVKYLCTVNYAKVRKGKFNTYFYTFLFTVGIALVGNITIILVSRKYQKDDDLDD